MEFITAEQFLKEDKEVQKVFIKYFKDTSTIVCDSTLNSIDIMTYTQFRINNGYIPLLTEGQLRKFIESKTGAKYIELEHYLKTGYDIYIENMLFEDLGNDLLQAYWKVAVQIAKENIDN